MSLCRYIHLFDMTTVGTTQRENRAEQQQSGVYILNRIGAHLMRMHVLNVRKYEPISLATRNMYTTHRNVDD